MGRFAITNLAKRWYINDVESVINRNFQMLRISALTLALLTAGCSQVYWDKAGGTQSQFLTDKYQCEKDMRQSGYFGTGLYGQMSMVEFGDRCMEARGYTKRVVAK